jgi:hypothetical protein
VEERSKGGFTKDMKIKLKADGFAKAIAVDFTDERRPPAIAKWLS